MDDYGYLDNQCNMYGGSGQFDLDPVMLQSLGFTQQEMETVNYIVMNGGRVTVSNLVNYCGIPYEEAKKLKYMYDICTGRVNISTEDDLSKHLRKMFGAHRRIGMQDLSVSRVGDIPRMALVGGLPADSPFAIWNSKNYPVNERMYKVKDVSGQNILIETTRIPVLKYKESKKIDGMLEIKEGPTNGKLVVAINKNFCKLCNRFVIVASLRAPEFHLGMIQIICIEGTKVYVFADTMNAKSYSRYGTNTQRVYDYGFYPSEIQGKLQKCALSIYQKLCGVYATPIEGNADFIVIPPEKKEDDDNDMMIIDSGETVDNTESSDL